jgi:tetraacyldisaccharide 4'-kinase
MNFLSSIILASLSAIYNGVTRLRLALYKKKILPIYNVGVPVISVGNLTSGGTGKTPIVKWLAHMVAKDGYRTCVLTRGYGRASGTKQVIVSDGENIFSDAIEGGDEPRLLAEKLLGKAAVICNADRVKAAKWAIENFRTEVFILDDAFQHLRITRNLNILVIDATNPWGGEKLLPSGHLREPLSGASRADCIIITRAEQVGSVDQLKERLKNLGISQPIYTSRVYTKRIHSIIEKETGTPELPKTIGAFCAIGNPESFFRHICDNGRSLVYKKTFVDHHIYKQSDIDLIVKRARSSGAEGLMTTEKDAVKLQHIHFDLPCYIVEIEIQIDEELELQKLVKKAIQSRH